MAEEALTVLSLCRAANNHRETYSCDRESEEGELFPFRGNVGQK